MPVKALVLKVRRRKTRMMVNVFLLVLVFAPLTAVQLPGLIKKRLIKETAIYLILMASAFVYSLGEVFNWKLPNPNTFLSAVFDSFSRYVFGESYIFK